MKKIAILCAVALVSLFLLSFLPVHGEAEIYDSVLRLHVIANSDSELDQSLKLKVRDSVALLVAELTADCQDLDSTCARVAENLERIEQVARQALDENGCSLPVTAELGLEKYPTKSYESVCFPAGEYRSLQIKIGEAEGRNWWCVLFPDLCLGAASSRDAEDAFIAAGLTPEQYRVVTRTEEPRYRLRFKILEAFGG